MIINYYLQYVCSYGLYILHRTFSFAQLYKVSTHCAFSPRADEHAVITMGDFLSLSFSMLTVLSIFYFQCTRTI